MKSRDALSLRLLLVLALLAVVGSALAAFIPQDALPQEESKLLEYAQEAMSRGDYPEAERAYQHYIKTFPAGAQIENAYAELAMVQHYGDRFQGARDTLLEFIKKFSKSPYIWEARSQLAYAYQRLNDRDAAKTLLRQIMKEAPDANTRTHAVDQYWELMNKRLWLYVNHSFTAGQEAHANVHAYNIDSAKMRAYRIGYDVLVKALATSEAPDLKGALQDVKVGDRTLMKEWTHSFKKDEEWQSDEIKFGATEPGIYILEAEHDEIVMKVTLFITRYGLITKTATGKLLVFAQDRASGKPVAGMSVRALNKEARCEGQTDAQGLFITNAYRGGTVVGLRDGEVVTTQEGYSEMQQAHPVVYITTDRPIYRPNQTVHFKAVHRREKGEKLETEASTPVRLVIQDPKGNEVYRAKHVLNEFGSTAGSFTLGDEPSLGLYTIQLTPEGEEPQEGYPWWLYAVSPANGQFRVEEYRKPEYKVDVKFQEPRVLQGETVHATIQADYYFGSPVAEAEIEYVVYRRELWSTWCCLDFYYDWYLADDEREERFWRGWGHGEEVHRGNGRTNKEGQFKVAFEARRGESDGVYTVVAKVTDLSRRTVEGSGSIKATRAEFSLAATTNKYVYKSGDRVTLKVRAQYPDETPATGANLTVKVFRNEWRRERSEEKLIWEGASRTDDHGIGELSFAPTEEGSLHATITSTDARGNEVSTGCWIWFGEGWGDDVTNFTGVDIHPDKKTYNPGETASILLTSQYKNIHVLVTLEGKEIYRQEVVQIKGHAKLYEFKLDDPALAPNVFLTVAAIKENSYIHKAKSIIINPSRRFLTVKVTPDKKTYRPREKARYTIETLDVDGRPVSAEVALGVVDESIYALQAEFAQDIRKHFVHRCVPQVETNCSLFFSDWGEAEGREAGETGGAPGAKAESEFALEKGAKADDSTYAATETRTLFADTALWLADVHTDASGKAVVEVAIPDNLTTWRATARAITKDSRFGQEISTVVARKNVIVRLEMPRFLTQNDATVISAVAHNYLAREKEFKVILQAEGLEVAGGLELTSTIAANDQKRFDWKATAKAAGSATLTVKLLSDEESDAMQVVVPVQPHGSVQWSSLAGLVDKRIVERVSISKEAQAGPGELTIVVSPTHAATVVDALDYLIGYPYGCVEQTMSRFLPCVVVAQAIQKLGLEKPHLLKELPKMVSQGLQRLYNFQHADGGWGWWQHDASAPPTTAYVMIGLALAQAADFTVDPGVFGRGVSALQNQIADEKGDDESCAYLLYALSLCGVNDTVTTERLSRKLGELSPYAKALLVLVLHKAGHGEAAKAALSALAKEVEESGAFAHWKGGADTGWFGHHMEVTAAALRAFVAIDAKHPLVPKVITWLSTVRQGNYWASTKQTALVVQALCEYIASTGEMNPDMTLSVLVNGKSLLTERVTKENWHQFKGSRVIPTRELNVGENEIVIEKTGSGIPIYAVYVKTYTQEENISASKEGLRVDRRYGLVSYERGSRIVTPLEEGETVRSGAEIEVTLTVNVDRPYQYLMIDDPLPSGFEPVRGDLDIEEWCWWYSHKEYRDERVSVAITHMGAGEQVIQYVMRAETPGELHILPARVWNMYHPQIGGNSAENRIKVVDR